MNDSDLPQSLDELSSEWLTETLRAAGVIERARVTRHSCELLGASGAGLIGTVARLRLEYDRQESGAPATAIVKLPTLPGKNRDIGELGGDYEREVRFYQELAASLAVRCPRCYVAHFVENTQARAERRLRRDRGQHFILLLEDMAPAHLGDDLAGASFGQAAAALRAAARLHAGFWQSPRLHELWWAWRAAAGGRRAQEAYERARPAFERHYEDGLPGRVRELLDWLAAHGGELRVALGQLPQTLLHVDFRLDNLFFSDKTADAEVTLFDWQATGIGPGASDVASFMSSSLPAEASAEEERELLRIYHGELVQSGVEGYPIETFEKHYATCVAAGFLSTVANFVSVDWGDEQGAVRRDRSLARRIARLGRLRLSDLPG